MFKGFYRDPTLKFDVDKMQSALKEVDSRVARQSPLGERDINAICLTQIPNDPNSITGGNVRGLYWTKPDSSYQEVQRAHQVQVKSLLVTMQKYHLVIRMKIKMI